MISDHERFDVHKREIESALKHGEHFDQIYFRMRDAKFLIDYAEKAVLTQEDLAMMEKLRETSLMIADRVKELGRDDWSADLMISVGYALGLITRIGRIDRKEIHDNKE